MKRYKNYMDGIQPSDTLHERLKNLKAPEKRPRRWVKWGALAAVLALVVGVGVWAAGTDRVGDAPSHRETAAIPGTALNWVDASGLEKSAGDYVLAPPDALSRDVTAGDVAALCGGEAALRDHLLWDGLDWSGSLWFLEDGAPQAAALYAFGDRLKLSLEITKSGQIPSCVVYPDESYERTVWQGVEITALKNTGYMVLDDGTELNESREVSFETGGVGYRLTIHAADPAQADELAARFVRYAVDGGFDLDALSAAGN